MAATDNISGHEGTFTYNSVVIAVTAWTFDETTEVLNVTDSSSGANSEFIPEGHNTRSGTWEGFVKDGTATPTIGGAAAAAILLAETGVSWTGSVILTGKTVSLQVVGGDAVKMSGTFQITGTWTETNA